MADPIRIAISITSSLEDATGVDLSDLGKTLHDHAESVVVDNNLTKSEHPVVVNTYISISESIAPKQFSPEAA